MSYNQSLCADNWRVTDHVCRICLGRILTRQTSDGGLESRCAECGALESGGHESLCVCGATLRDGRDAGLRCVPNPERRPEVPAEIIVAHVGRQPSEVMVRFAGA